MALIATTGDAALPRPAPTPRSVRRQWDDAGGSTPARVCGVRPRVRRPLARACSVAVKAGQEAFADDGHTLGVQVLTVEGRRQHYARRLQRSELMCPGARQSVALASPRMMSDHLLIDLQAGTTVTVPHVTHRTESCADAPMHSSSPAYLLLSGRSALCFPWAGASSGSPRIYHRAEPTFLTRPLNAACKHVHFRPLHIVTLNQGGPLIQYGQLLLVETGGRVSR